MSKETITPTGRIVYDPVMQYFPPVLDMETYSRELVAFVTDYVPIERRIFTFHAAFEWPYVGPQILNGADPYVFFADNWRSEVKRARKAARKAARMSSWRRRF